MSVDKFIEQFSGALDELPEGPLSPGVRFKELKAWDSLAVLTVTDEIDIEYGVILRKSDFAEQNTIEELYQLVRSKQSS
ncbi:MAG: acyl carrier protein [Lentimonas sp.]|jgi:acyl carrier protein